MTTSSLRAGVLLLGALLLVAAGCTSVWQRTPPATTTALAPAGVPSNVTGPAPAPPTEGKDASGQLVRLKDHRGKVVLLSFWHGA